MITPEIKAHLAKDKKLKKVIDKVDLVIPKPGSDLYLNLLRAIAGQQLSMKAASTIWERVLNLFPERYPHPEFVLAMDVEQLRSAGLSYQKAGYLKNIARFSIDETLNYRSLKKRTDEDLVLYLTQIKGVGRWTVEMILMFGLVRPDVFPFDDLGIQNAVKRLYGIALEGKQLRTEMEKISLKWQPYRTFASMYLWRSLEL